MSAEVVRKTILIAVSGSGGHILPGRYFAESYLKEDPSSEITFIGSGRPIEETLIDAHGFSRKVVNIGGVRRLGLKGLLGWLMKLPAAICELLRIFKECQPCLIMGFGGYASVLPILLGRLQGIPTWIHEAELEPGWANQFLYFFARRISISRSDCKLANSPKATFTGQPLDSRLENLSSFTRTPNRPPRILVTGGSQGAQFLDELFGENYAQCEFKILHQCRLVNMSNLQEKALAVQIAPDSSDQPVRVQSFIDDMAEALKWCDILVCRGGANAIRDAIIAKVPTIVVPLPKSPEQLENAQMIVNLRRGVVFEEEQLSFSMIKNQIAAFTEDYEAILAGMLEPKEPLIGGTAKLVASVKNYLATGL